MLKLLLGLCLVLVCLVTSMLSVSVTANAQVSLAFYERTPGPGGDLTWVSQGEHHYKVWRGSTYLGETSGTTFADLDYDPEAPCTVYTVKGYNPTGQLLDTDTISVGSGCTESP